MSSRVVVELRNVIKVYKGNKFSVRALKGINLKVSKGELLIIMGPSGSGKSTLLNIIGTLDKPTRGRVIIDGRDVTDLDEDELAYIRCRKIGFVFQFFNLIGNFTALENVMLPLILSGEYTIKEAKEKALTLLELVGLKRYINSRPSQLSGGQQQRVAIARALANDPAIILMDEPTGSIDVATAARILSLVKWLNEKYGYTFLIVTHNPEVASIGTRVLYMRDGKLFNQTPKVLFKEMINIKDVSLKKFYLKALKIELEKIKREINEGKLNYEDALRKIKEVEDKIRRLGVKIE